MRGQRARARQGKGAAMAIDPKNDPHARIVTTPLPSQAAKEAGAPEKPEGASGARPARRVAAKASNDPFIRAENEDDDGYDPYSDRPAPPEPMFQEDPWA